MSKPSIVPPAIGRRLHYFASSYDRGLTSHKPETLIEADPGQPCDAVIVRVWNDRMVNLVVYDHNGNVHKRTSVTLHQPGDHITHTDGGYAAWKDRQVRHANPKQQPTTFGKFFVYCHLPAHLQLVSKPLAQVAELFEVLLPSNAEKSAGMRKLMEAKDCFVRASLELPADELLARAPVTDSDRLAALFSVMFGTDGIDKATMDRILEPFEVEALTDLSPEVMHQVLTAIVQHLRQPKPAADPIQHTEDPDHGEA